MTQDDGLVGLVCALIAVAAILVAIVLLVPDDHGTPPAQFPLAPYNRSCFEDFCVQALPGHLVRVTDRAGNVEIVRMAP